MATRELLADLAAAWQRQGGAALVLESVGGVDAARRVAAGEASDLVVLASEAIDKLEAAGHVVPGSKMDLVRSEVAVAVRAGSPRPDIGTAEALRETLQRARSIGHSTGPSGTALLQLFDRWRVSDDLRARLRQAPPGVAVGTMVARGEVEIGLQQRSELIHLPGIELLGPMPEGTQIVTTFCGALCAVSDQGAAVRELLQFLRSACATGAARRQGMEPA
jgi:molybdate transport system substrate-binding protein